MRRGLVVAALIPSVVGAQAAPNGGRLRFVGEALQFGPVGYRDPRGVMSPDGQWLVFTSQGYMRLMHVAGGPLTAIGPRGMTRAFAWQPDSRHVAALSVDSAATAAWWLVDVPSGTRRPLWSGPFPKGAPDSTVVDPNRFDEIAWSASAGRLAGVIVQQRGSVLWTGNADGTSGRIIRTDASLTSLAWAPNGDMLACLVAAQGKHYLSIPCGTLPGPSRVEAYGPLAFSPQGTTIYFSTPNARGTLDVVSRAVKGGPITRLTSFARDTYAPSVAKDGRLLFGLQDYRTYVAVMPAGGGAAKQLSAFQSETPTWSRDDKLLGVTYGTWRRIVDDLHYPDIAQDLGAIQSDVETPAKAPFKVVRASASEDQGMDWSPNGRWIVLHSHANGLDDVWIQPADGSAPARAITKGGTETGWPRWSPNGRWIAYATEIQEGNRTRAVLFTVGIDPTTAAVTREAQRVAIDGLSGEVDQVEWSSTSDSLLFDAELGPTERAIYVVPRDGGTPRLVHRFTSPQRFSGVGVSPDFRWAVFVAPAPDGHMQLFRVPTSGGAATQLTFDPTDKTQPAVSHDGTRIAFTVYTYTMQFWVMEPN